ncbi:hypothetical protein JTE90_000454 [Oedothorax gibbosus]|uniref:BTB domain-containing protein n=1 Tax=Oedothorax gibbosus TaxID=931172 RepID=A0AAV6UEL2_9ARAC|nr:hypothetical protein JTE90_000454 [Oedothorax gibbosus]
MSRIRKRCWTIINRIGNFFRCNRNTEEENPHSESEDLSDTYLDHELLHQDLEQEQPNDTQVLKFDSFDSDIDYISSDYTNESTESFRLVTTTSDKYPYDEFQKVYISKGEDRDKVDGNEKECFEPRSEEMSNDFHGEIKTLVREESDDNGNPELKMKGPNSVVIVNGHEFDVQRTVLRRESIYFEEALAGPENKLLVLHINSEECQGCFNIAYSYLCAKAVNQEHLFGHLKSKPRTLLLKEEFLALWDTDIFDPNYTKIVAATKIQAAFRGYRTRKQLSNNEDPKIRKWYSNYSMTSVFESEIRKDIVGQTPRFEYK